ncbi:MAG: ABC transporter ATP-binding protein [Acidimicrobiia bacterium]|nr:ABC transporter ATP-binding protein [Acidimicrobiia bacterium]
MAVVEARDLVKRFRVPAVRRDTVREHALDLFRRRPAETFTVLDGISFAVQCGETIGIMGRNGSGKSTLLKILSGIYQPDRGQVITRAPLTPILELGVGWNPELDAVDNVCLLGVVMGMSLAEVRAATDDILAFAALERFANMKLRHFSSGMAARLAYSVAFTAVRDVLVLDEVFAVGDAGFKARCEQRYRDLRAAGHTVILVSHDPRIISTYCPRALLLENGRVVADGPGADVASTYLAMLT